MKLFVCVKPVPDTGASIELREDHTPDLTQIPLIINPYDESAIEEAVRIIEARGSGEIVLITAGGTEADPVLKSAMATGADRAILVETDPGHMDSAATARSLASAIQADGLPDMILTGRTAVDTESFQTAYRLAAELDLPVVTEVSRITLPAPSQQTESITVTREAGSGEQQVLTVPLPCVISVTKAINTPRYPRLPDIIKAKKKELRYIPAPEAEPAPSGFQVTGMAPMPDKGQADILTGDTTEQVDALIRRIAPLLGSKG